MAFYDDVIFPASISANGFGGRRVRKTDIGVTLSGSEQRTVVWMDGLREYEAGMVPRPASEWRQIDALFDIVQGSAHGFRLRDPTDYTVDLTAGVGAGYQPINGSLSTGGVGAGLPQMQLAKRYSFGARSYDRPLLKLVTGSVSVRRNGTPVTVGGAAGNISIDVNTGRVTFVADQIGPVTAITVGASTQITTSISGSAIGQTLYVNGFTGADAALLNGQAFLVTNKVGSVHTLAVNTAGRTITIGSPSAYLYPQPADTITCSAQFHVPVRFMNDELPWTWEAFNGGDPYIAGSIPLVEIRT